MVEQDDLALTLLQPGCDLNDRLATFEPSFGRSQTVSPLDQLLPKC